MTQEINCSDAARMLIERMQTNPEDFNYGGKLYRVTEKAQMSARDLKAYVDAHDTYIKEPRLMVHVLESLLVQPEEEEMRVRTQGPISGTTVDKVWFDELTDSGGLINQKRITREMYEDHIEAHKNALKAKPPSTSKLSDIYNKAFGRERVERDN